MAAIYFKFGSQRSKRSPRPRAGREGGPGRRRWRSLQTWFGIRTTACGPRWRGRSEASECRIHRSIAGLRRQLQAGGKVGQLTKQVEELRKQLRELTERVDLAEAKSDQA